jgi:hypothetical protein
MHPMDEVLADPRLVTRTFGGKEWRFWFTWIGRYTAKERHGYDITQQADVFTDADAHMESVYRSLWVCALPFDPSMTFEEFAMHFAFSDFVALRETLDEVVAKQLAPQDPKKKGAGKE